MSLFTKISHAIVTATALSFPISENFGAPPSTGPDAQEGAMPPVPRTPEQDTTPKKLSKLQADLEPADAVGSAVPESHTRSTTLLASYLRKNTSSDLEFARAAFSWIAHNIVYDVDALQRLETAIVDPSEVLAHRLTVCQGYAALFKELCDKGGVQCEIISGVAKGAGYSDLERNPGPHAWNRILIDGKWRLVETTWASGSIGPDGEFNQKYIPKYFDVSPKHLISTHLPNDPSHQHLARPVTKEEFFKSIRKTIEFFSTGLHLVSPTQSIVPVRDQFSVVVSGLNSNRLQLKVEDLKGNIIPAERVLCEKENGKVRATVRFPQTGNFRVHVFFGEGDQTLLSVASFTCQVQFSTKALPPFPKSFVGFTNLDAHLIAPQIGVITADKPTEFAVKLPNALDAQVVQNNKWTKCERDGDVFRVTLTPESGEVKLCVRYGEKEDYKVLLAWRVE